MRRNKYFESKRRPIEKRKSEIRDPKPPAILIITEGKKTEPLYFRGLADYISRKYGDNIDINPTPKLEISGKGMVTVSLVEEAINVVQHAKRRYSEVWVLFDRDDNKDFDEAIALAKRNDIRAAWSNSCFEYWLLLHFKEDSVARTPADWKGRLDIELKKAQIIQADYNKANAEISVIPLKNGLLKRAYENAVKREKQQAATIPSKQDPGTTVHHLISSLRPYIGQLL